MNGISHLVFCETAVCFIIFDFVCLSLCQLHWWTVLNSLKMSLHFSTIKWPHHFGFISFKILRGSRSARVITSVVLNKIDITEFHDCCPVPCDVSEMVQDLLTVIKTGKKSYMIHEALSLHSDDQQ